VLVALLLEEMLPGQAGPHSSMTGYDDADGSGTAPLYRLDFSGGAGLSAPTAPRRNLKHYQSITAKTELRRSSGQ
jgi:hypothetical protein